MKIELYDPAARAAEKELSRSQNDADLRSGRVGAAEMQRRSGFLDGDAIGRAVIVERKAFD